MGGSFTVPSSNSALTISTSLYKCGTTAIFSSNSGSGLCGGSLEPASAGPAYPRACRGSRFPRVVPCGKGDGTPNSGGAAAASGKDQVLPGAARSGFRSQNAEGKVLIVYQDVELLSGFSS